MARFPISKTEKRELIEDFLSFIAEDGVVFAEEVEDEEGSVSLDPCNRISDLLAEYLKGKKIKDEEE